MRRKIITRYYIILSFTKDGDADMVYPKPFKQRRDAKKMWEEQYKGHMPFHCLKESIITEIV